MTKNIYQKKRNSIRWKLLSAMLGLIIGLLLSLTFVQIYSQKGILENELENRTYLIKKNLYEQGKTLSDNLAFQVEEALASFNLLDIINQINKAVKENESLKYIILMDMKGAAIIHTLNPELQESVLAGEDDRFAVETTTATINEFDKEGVSYMEFIVPIRVSTEQWGVLRLGYSLENLYRVITASHQKIEKQTFSIIIRSVWTTVVFICIGSGIVLFLSSRLTKPLTRLTQMAQDLAKGSFPAAEKLESGTKDEVGMLTKTFIEMSKELKTSYEKLEDYSYTLEKRVEKRTEELSRANELLKQEIDERKRIEVELEEAKEIAMAASKAKSEFLASMSHEIRTPMNAIIGMADLLWETKLTPEQSEYVRVFRSAGDNLLQIINDILDLSKVEAGQIKLENVAFDLHELVEKSCEILAFSAHEKGLELSCHLAPDVPAFLSGDPIRLRQILINLIGNAVKFTEKGEVIVCVNNDPCAERKGGLLFSVSDTGIGIPEEKLGVIFESFSQVDASTTRKYGGTGLGLSISKRLVELMQGRIWVESVLGRGSTFSFTVKLDVQSGKQKPVEAITGDIKKLKTLVIDDNATNRMILRQMLSELGIAVADAPGGKEGLSELKRAKDAGEPYNLLLLDCRMPDMDGFQVTEHIKSDPAIANLIVMMLTSDDRAEDIGRAKELGVTMYLVKPIRRAHLLDIVHSVVTSGKAIIRDESPSACDSRVLPEFMRPLRLLLVEDYVYNCILVQAYLKNTPYQIDIAENGMVCVEKFKTGKYDLVLMDMQMPVMDGYAATKEIRKYEENNGLEAIPIIALSAYAFGEDIQKSLDAGCNDHLTKPLKKQLLLETIQKHTALKFPGRATEKSEKETVHPEIRPKEKSLVCVSAEFKEFIPDFLVDIRNDVKSMIKALDNNDYETIKIIAHRVKGTAGGFGFDKITNIGKFLEAGVKEKNQKDIQKWLNELSDHLEIVEVVYV